MTQINCSERNAEGKRVRGNAENIVYVLMADGTEKLWQKWMPMVPGCNL